uniref:Uncharacterized protein n=1 Tax=Monopterus albus TaxID=43700 RepID=A0A3Q3J396_MONAL
MFKHDRLLHQQMAVCRSIRSGLGSVFCSDLFSLEHLFHPLSFDSMTAGLQLMWLITCVKVCYALKSF